MKRASFGMSVAWVAMLLALPAHAQDANAPSAIAPLPTTAPDALQRRITPEAMDAATQGIYTTKKTTDEAAPVATVPVVTSGALPWKSPAPLNPSGASPKLPANIPFGRGSSPGPAIPSGPHTAIAVPVVDVDAAEAAAAAAPTPVDAGADPVSEDPAQPTELTSPIFTDVPDNGAPRKMTFRVLNKVTGQSALLEAKPGEHLTFGQIDIVAVMCRASAPTSQTDYAGLLDIREQLPGKTELKPLFRGWMYASSPSITALEHPIYDVTMVTCEIAGAKQEADDKASKKAAKKAKH